MSTPRLEKGYVEPTLGTREGNESPGTTLPRGRRTDARRHRLPSFGPRYPTWLAGPLLGYYLLFFVAPLLILGAFAFARQANSFAGEQIIYGFYTDSLKQVLDALYVNVFLQTFAMAAVGTLATVVVGFPLAYWMARHVSPRRKNLLLLLVIVPFWTSFLIRTFAWKIILDGDGSFAGALGLDILFTWKAVLIGLVYGYLPLFVLPAYAALERMDWTLVDAALDLGATPWKAFREVTLPLTRPGMLAGTLLVFIPMAGEYVIPEILGGGRFLFIGNVIQGQFIGASNWPFGSAVALALMALLSVFVILYLVSAMKEEQFGA